MSDAAAGRPSVLDELHHYAENRLPTILYGPPGTGKSRMVELLLKDLEDTGTLGLETTVQFHQKFAYEDFIEGFRPDGNAFVKRDGVFKEFCGRAGKRQERIDVFVVDEINRADIATTFGEVLYALEDRSSRSVTTTHFGDVFAIPESLFLVGTMNTADRGIAHFDFAVRRRFQFIPVFPDPDRLSAWLSEKVPHDLQSFSIDEYVNFFSRTNLRISRSKSLGPHMQLGEAIFVPNWMEGVNDSDLHRNFINAVLPQVESYLGFGSATELRMIFNPAVADAFAQERWVDPELFIGLIREAQSDRSGP